MILKKKMKLLIFDFFSAFLNIVIPYSLLMRRDVWFENQTRINKKLLQICKNASLPAGAVAYYSAHLQDIIQYADLKQNLFQNFQEVGNAIIFFKMLEQALAVEEMWDLVHAAPFQNLIPKPYVKRKS